jgi:outer membrane protein TolC
VATAETIALQAQLSRVNILNRYMNASVLLVKALGGGWRVDALGQSAGRLYNLNIINGS